MKSKAKLTKKHKNRHKTRRSPISRVIRGLLLIVLLAGLTPVARAVRPKSRREVALALALAGVVVLAGLNVGYNAYIMGQTSHRYSMGNIPPSLTKAFHDLSNDITKLENDQSKHELRVIDDENLRGEISTIQIQTQAGHYSKAKREIFTLNAKVRKWQLELTKRLEVSKAATEIKNSPVAGVTVDALNIPILLYHYTPTDFEQQLQILVERRYNVVSLDQVAAALAGRGSLPSKPVVITFDDGFANQMVAFRLLQKYQMRATYYIINAGEASQWCIGAGRRYGQTPGCGDDYLTWDQIRTLDRSGLIDIGGHTMDHVNLASKSPEIQRFEIEASKAGIEKEIGHVIRHFCFPYGSYNATTIQLVEAAGYATATTTLPGTYQNLKQPYTMRRIRDTYALP